MPSNPKHDEILELYTDYENSYITRFRNEFPSAGTFSSPLGVPLTLPPHPYSLEGAIGAYNNYSINTQYSWLEGLIPLPVAAPPLTAPLSDTSENPDVGFDATQDPTKNRTKTDFCRVHAPMGLKTVRWSCVREGLPPTIPAIDLQPGEVLLSSTITVEAPKLAGDGVNRIFRATGTITIGMASPLKNGDRLRVGNPPCYAANSPAVIPQQAASGII